MKKIRLGKTNLTVAGLGWGTIPLQRAGDDDAVSLVKAVVEMGVDFIDTARAYTTSEQRIGLALQDVKKQIVLSSKSMSRTDGIYKDVKISLDTLKVNKINIYSLHNVSSFQEYDNVLLPNGAYSGLKKAREDGLIDYIGITSHNLKVLERAIQDGYFDVIMACYSFLELDAAEKIFPMARKKDTGILAMKSYSGGVIKEPGPALRYVLQAQDVLPIPGSETIDMAGKNWEVFTENRGLTPNDRNYIESLKKQVDKQFCRRCDYCLPCSEGISIQYALGLKETYNRFGPGAKLLMAVFDKARNCTECGQCMERCSYGLPIPQLIKKNLKWLDEQLSKNK